MERIIYLDTSHVKTSNRQSLNQYIFKAMSKAQLNSIDPAFVI